MATETNLMFLKVVESSDVDQRRTIQLSSASEKVYQGTLVSAVSGATAKGKYFEAVTTPSFAKPILDQLGDATPDVSESNGIATVVGDLGVEVYTNNVSITANTSTNIGKALVARRILSTAHMMADDIDETYIYGAFDLAVTGDVGLPIVGYLRAVDDDGSYIELVSGIYAE